MPPRELFDAARRAIGRHVIESLLPGGEWRSDGDYWVRSPLRADANIGSFHVTEAGLWKDFSSGEGGDLIDLVVAMRGGTKVAAAQEICRLGGVSIPERERKSKPKKDRIEPQLPIPPEALKGLNHFVHGFIAKLGEPALGSRYCDAEGRALFCVVRFERGDTKEIRPYYLGVDGEWQPGQAMDHGRPLLHLVDVLASSGARVLVVEGEKKCEAARKLLPPDAWQVVTWCGGSAAVERTDWAPLAGRVVTVWPDRDAPGLKAAQQIRNRLPHAEVLSVEGKPEHWDVADAIDDGLDIVAFLRDCPRLPTAEEARKRLPFSFLGHDEVRYWFLPRKRRVPYRIDMGRFTASQLLELAPLAQWQAMSMIKDSGAIKTDAAQDWIIDQQESVGMVNLRRLRGAGVWRDGLEIIVNDGRQMVTMAGERVDYEEYHSAEGAEYIPSETRFGDMTGEESSDAEGEALLSLFCSQSFARQIEPVLLLGWSLIAPFGGLLTWRPHLWLTGKKGAGKSQVILALLVDPLLGEFAHYGVGRKTTEAGLRRSINLTAKPVRIDEMEAKGKTGKERIDGMMNLPILAAQDTSSHVTMASGSGEGVITYVVRSCFLFASVNRPEDDAQAQSRFVQVEKLEIGDIRSEAVRMARECARVMREPGRYRRRLFRAMPALLQDIPRARALLLEIIPDPRECDLLAPLLCAVGAVRTTGSIDTEAGHRWLSAYLDDAVRAHDDRVDDEDRVVQHILSASVRTDDNKTRTVAELLADAVSVDAESERAQSLLSRHGLRITDYANGDGRPIRVLAVVANADPLRRVLADTPFAGNYEAQLARHPLHMGAKKVRTALGVCRCRCLRWEPFRAQYLGVDGQKEIEE